MKTANKEIDLFKSELDARKSFNKTNSADLLHSPKYGSYFVDKSKTALKAWPNLYVLIDTK